MIVVAIGVLETTVLNCDRNGEVLGSTVDSDGENKIVDVGCRINEGEDVIMSGTELVSDG